LIATLNVPVCIIGRRAHPETEFGTPLDRVLLATSFDRGSSLLGRFASTLAEINDAQLTLIHVLDTQGVSKQQREMERLVARQMLSSLVPAEARHRNKPVLLIREGDPATIILEEAGSLPHDVVILGSSHSSMVSRLLADSVVHRVVIESQCPVITIKSSSLSSLEEVHESTSSEVMSAHS
jgi:nucleotide-binding universal stress UspA family protein